MTMSRLVWPGGLDGRLRACVTATGQIIWD